MPSFWCFQFKKHCVAQQHKYYSAIHSSCTCLTMVASHPFILFCLVVLPKPIICNVYSIGTLCGSTSISNYDWGYLYGFLFQGVLTLFLISSNVKSNCQYHIVNLQNLNALISSVLLESFQDEKEILWCNLIRAFFWTIWGERNCRIFCDKERSFNSLLESLVFFLAITW